MGTVEQKAEIDFYDSPYLTENWDLISQGSEGYDSDVIFYWNAFLKVKELSESYGNPSVPLVVVDVGTGTGRVLKGLNRYAKQNNLLLPDTEFIGIDISQHMLDRAAEETLSQVGRVSWRCGSATELSTLLKSSSKPSKVDFIFCAVHSVGHLIHPGELEKFFADVANLLRPHSGRACISIWKHYMLSTEDEEAKTQYNDVESPPMVLASKKFSGVMYRNHYRGEELANDILASKTDVHVFRQHENGDEEIIETIPTVLRYKMFREPTLMRILESSGLEVLNKETNVMDFVFTLKLK
ncbi:hypothetical protein N7491_011075 [Penicillium cf. griseofulvum]|uniref:Methyltransferase domain-containing protein n=1 Tax=Penicillium cf. griseofulvum TaxID=2972120 RepID=A0A9W9N103_9EURO|nr:hypothetical protein N7472_001394 [Penicillium cf. griseofulvum]KAJ5422630.1 hypothetical protein N7491_011075 [Penicillium cf. griseofulvum]KAJ5428807.1 hypothetical protein N7445_010261 [Penicillium cf. griseofulvum]